MVKNLFEEVGEVLDWRDANDSPQSRVAKLGGVNYEDDSGLLTITPRKVGQRTQILKVCPSISIPFKHFHNSSTVSKRLKTCACYALRHAITNQRFAGGLGHPGVFQQKQPRNLQ